MRKLTSIIMVVCGILVLVGLFLPWASFMGFDSSGWDAIDSAGIDDAFSQLLVLIGALLVIGCSGYVMIMSFIGKGKLRILRTMEIVSLVGATTAVAITLPTLIQYAIGDTAVGDIGYGLYISTILAIVGVIVGALAATRITKKKVEAD
jgi:hypothetical protein